MAKERRYEDTGKELWKLISDLEVEHKGETFGLKTWVYPCGGAVEYREDLDEQGQRVYLAEQFELSPTTCPIGADDLHLVFIELSFLQKQESMLNSLHTSLDSRLRGNDMNNYANLSHMTELCVIYSNGTR